MIFARRALWLCLLCAVLQGFAAPLEWQAHGPHRQAALQPLGRGQPGFSFVPGTISGVLFTNVISEKRSLTNQIYLNGSGVAAGDVDGDGWCDLYFCGLDNQNELYRNTGNWRFERITEQAGVACADAASTGAAFADIDGDGDLDLLVNAIGRGTRLFLNDGSGHFSEATGPFGLQGNSGAMSLALADVDGDGFLDLYVVNYRSSTFRDEPEKRFRVNNVNGRFELLTVDGRSVNEPDLLGRFTVNPASGVEEHGEADAFYRNRGGQRFEKVAWNSGTFLTEAGKPAGPLYDWGLSAMFHDINNDGAPDLYVCNDFQSEDRLWINDGKGHFRLAPPSTLRHTSLFSMGVDFADIDRDGHDDFFVGDMLSRDHSRRQIQRMDRAAAAMLNTAPEVRPQYSRNSLFWNRGDGSFAEIAFLAGLEASEWSWTPAFLDVDLDGYEDLLITAGHARDAQNIDITREIEFAKKSRQASWREQIEMRRRFPRLEFPLLAFRNGHDLTFQFIQSEWGFTNAAVAQGMALADLDNDGDLDLAVSCLNGPAFLYRNECAAPRIAIWLRGVAPNTHGIGAKVSVLNGALPLQSQEIMAGGRYLSSDDSIRSFAAGSSTNLKIVVRWRSGRESRLEHALPNHLYELSESGAMPAQATAIPSEAPIFEDVSSMLNHQHEDQPFDDFQRQPLLPRKFSSPGPGVSFYDVNGDGWEDLIIPAGRTGRIAIFQNSAGKFTSVQPEALCRPGTRDRTTILGWQNGTHRNLLIGSANYEDGLTNGPCARQFDWNTGVMDDTLPGSAFSTGPLAMADADGDGDLDLFVGARVQAGHYPEPGSSAFFRNERGKLVFDAKISSCFEHTGLISAAVWSDLDHDGTPELVLACDEGPVRVFAFRNQLPEELTVKLGFDQWVGRWNSVAIGDFDSDGRMDIVAGNWGRNSPYQAHLPGKYYIYYSSDPSEPATVLEAYFDQKLNSVVPLQDLDSLSILFPNLKQQFPTFTAFSTASVDQVLGDLRPRFHAIRINTLDSMLFLNRGGRFEASALPAQAQFAPVFGLAIGDVDADGCEDIVLAQNFFGTAKGNSRFDGGRGLLLRGNGKGEFEEISSKASGLMIDGEGRGAALCDYDHDGRLDLAVGQNAGPTRLFRNAIARRGIRILLHGSPENPAAIGSSVRLLYADGSAGPRHELHAGEGYWSQTSGAIIAGAAKPVKSVEVRWPNGKTEQQPLRNGADSIDFKFQ